MLKSRYRDLVCLAYLVLDDGKMDERDLAARAHRAVWESGGGVSYEILRRRLLTRLLRDQPRAGRAKRWFGALSQPRMPRWLGLSVALPWREGPPPRRGPDARAMLALGAIDGLTVTQARAVITAAFDGRDDIPAAPGDDQPVPGAGQLSAALAGFDASLLSASPGPLTRRGRRRRALLGAGAVVLLVAAYIAGTTAWENTRHSGDPTVTSLDAWRSDTMTKSVRDWPAEGNLTSDWPLLRAAATAYRAGERLDPGDSVYVLYAGDLPGTGPLVVLGTGSLIEDPVDSYQPGAQVPLTRLGMFPDTDDNAPYLIPLPGNRLLVPPWRTGLSMAWLNGFGTPLSWRPLTVRDGVATETTNDVRAPLCIASLAVVRYRDASFGSAFTGTVVVAPPGAFGQLAWPAQVVLNGHPENVPPVILGSLADVTCEDGADANWLYDGGYELDVFQYGQATLPGAGLVRVIGLDAEDATFRTARLEESTPLGGSEAEFLDSSGLLTTGACSAPGLAAAWWKGPRGTWYLLAAGAGSLRAYGATGSLRVVRRSGAFTVFSGVPSETGPVTVTTSGSRPAEAITVLSPST